MKNQRSGHVMPGFTQEAAARVAVQGLNMLHVRTLRRNDYYVDVSSLLAVDCDRDDILDELKDIAKPVSGEIIGKLFIVDLDRGDNAVFTRWQG
jgi:hypothetical protein